MMWPKTLTDDDMLILRKEWQLAGGWSGPHHPDVMDFFNVHSSGGIFDRAAMYNKIKGLWRRTYSDGKVELIYPFNKVKA